MADVIIVGGGPAGSSCAWNLQRLGLSAIVLDRAVFPRHKVCAGWITPGVLHTLGIDADDYRAGGRTLQPITAFQTAHANGPELLTRYGQPVSYGIRRCEFDAYLLARSGARVRDGVAAARIERTNGMWIVNGRFTAPVLVGAGGHFCPVARLLNATLREDVIAAQEIEFQMDRTQQARCRVKADIPELYLCRDLKGYGWCFRKGNYLNVGFGRQDKNELPAHTHAFVQFLVERGRVPADLPAHMLGHAYLLYGTTRRKVAADDIYLIGDAAGMAYPQSGEGIRPAVESGLMAAEAIAKHSAEHYERALALRFGDRSPASWCPASVAEYIAPYLLSMRWFARHVFLDRWFLHRHEAMLHAIGM